MTTDLNTPSPGEETPPSFGIGKLLFVLALVIILFLLLHSMVHHRFFRGGRVSRHGTVVQ